MAALNAKLKTTAVIAILASPAFADTSAPILDGGDTLTPAVAQRSTSGPEVSESPEAPVPMDAIRIISTHVGVASELVAAHHGLILDLSATAKGQVSDLLLTGSVEDMMGLIATETNIRWFVYGGTLEVTSPADAVTRFIPLNDHSMDDVTRILIGSEIDPETVGLTHIADGNALRVSGSPKAVEIVEAVLSLAEKDAAPSAAQAIVVRRGVAKTAETYGAAAVPQLINNPAAATDLETEEQAETEEAVENEETRGDES